MSTATTAQEQIQELERQIENLKHRSVLELKVKLAAARNEVSELEAQIAKITGKAVPAEKPTGRKPRVSITIDQVVEAIKNGATNYKSIANVLGCSSLTVAKKVEAEGKKAGIKSTGQKASFKLMVK